MSDTLVRQLSEWLAATDIALLELRGPGVQVRLHHDGKRVEPIPGDEPLTPAAAEDVVVRAHSVGIFLHTHPLHETPLATPGQCVTAGQTIGLLRIGALLLPVTAPGPGTFVDHTAQHGSTVGYGTPLLLFSRDPATTRSN
ncbi:MAG: acetyl-CoA carboxylase biotin carboxyl carrier protein subunit [Burkholderiales bacterium]|nr:acetyl-CoA carboxylase biotin carboxyl carrier protein subunit [Burkholderiales bacterium]